MEVFVRSILTAFVFIFSSLTVLADDGLDQEREYLEGKQFIFEQAFVNPDSSWLKLDQSCRILVESIDESYNKDHIWKPVNIQSGTVLRFASLDYHGFGDAFNYPHGKLGNLTLTLFAKGVDVLVNVVCTSYLGSGMDSLKRAMADNKITLK